MESKPSLSISSLIFLLTLTIQSSLAQLCLKEHSKALLQLKEEFIYDESASLGCNPAIPRMFSWKFGTDCCSWNGVTCDTITGHVTGLDLSCSGLNGNLTSNSSLFRLSKLNKLNLAFNDFNRSFIPPEFGQFSGLVYLNLSTTWFSGPIPSEFSYLSKLVTLDLSLNNNLQLGKSTVGMIARNLSRVEEVYLDYIDMSLVDVTLLANFSSSLTSLSLVLCNLMGEFPENIFRFPNVEYIDLGLNSDLKGHRGTSKVYSRSHKV